MENSFNQLRFDISEKVRLHPQQAGIGTLLEMDLYPDVEIKDEGQHLRIQGYLRLNGTYLTKQEEKDYDDLVHTDTDVYGIQRQEIAYVIPVEITLPAERVEMAYISTEVETFDYQVLSPFELHIEAILMIDGLLPDQQEEWEGREAEKEVAYEYPVFSGSPAQSLSIYGEEEPDQIQQASEEKKFEAGRQGKDLERTSPEKKVTKLEEPNIEDVKDLKVIDHAHQDSKSVDQVPKYLHQEESESKPVNPSHIWTERQERQPSVHPPLTRVNEHSNLKHQETPTSNEKLSESQKGPQGLQDSKEVQHHEKPTEEQKETRSMIPKQNQSLQPKKTDSPKEDPTPQVIQLDQSKESSLAPPAQSLEENEQKEKVIEKKIEAVEPDEKHEAGQGKESSKVDEHDEEKTTSSNHWIHWLVKNREEEFSPMRMVIVQKDESLAQIAERYEVSTGYLLRMNQLQSDELVEGQMLYIPKS